MRSGWGRAIGCNTVVKERSIGFFLLLLTSLLKILFFVIVVVVVIVAATRPLACSSHYCSCCCLAAGKTIMITLIHNQYRCIYAVCVLSGSSFVLSKSRWFLVFILSCYTTNCQFILSHNSSSSLCSSSLLVRPTSWLLVTSENRRL